jgi:hypothetical protein
MEVHESISCCNFVELVGFNGEEDRKDYDIYDSNVYNTRAGVLAVAKFAGAARYAECPEVGSVFMTTAWDDPEFDDGQQDQTRPEELYRGRMERMKRYIKDNKLGWCHEIPLLVNPNHDSTIMTVIWEICYDGLCEWYQKNGYKIDHNREGDLDIW